MELLTVPIGQIEANTWNCNHQSPLQYEALIESLRKFPSVLDGQQVIDKDTTLPPAIMGMLCNHI